MRILLVDDEKMVLEDSCHVIQNAVKEKVEILTADSSKEALQIALANPSIDVAFLDIEMPGLDGIALAKELQKIKYNINIIFLTAFPNYAIEAYKLRASDYLLKPLMEEDVLHALNGLRYAISTNSGETNSITITQRENNIVLPKLRLVCFERFTVFIGDRILRFRREKAKEIFAYLVAKRGVEASIVELCDALWPEDGDARQRYCWKLMSELRLSLRDYDVEDVLLRGRDNYAVDVSRLECDYYDYLDKKIAWNGLFMEQYSDWAESIKGKLYFENAEHEE